ncbi:MAG TPA: peptidylprolyl isomerase [Candidatus Binatia bacterium]
MRRESIFRGRACAAALAVALLLAAGPAKAVVVVNRVVATVDGEPITSYQVDAFIAANVRGVDPSTISEADRRKVLDLLINDMIVELESSRLGVGVSNEEVNAYIEQIKKQNNLDDAKLAAALEQQGLTMESYRAQVRKEIQRSQLLARNVRSQVNITPEQIQKYYDEHKEQFSEADAVTVRHIFFTIPQEGGQAAIEQLGQKAQRAYERLQKGEPFAQVARDMSESPDASQGGMLGTLKRGQMRPELEQVAFSLRKGQYSQPIQSPFGLHILYIEDRQLGTSVPLEEVQDKIRERLYAQAVEQRFQEWVTEDLRKGHSVVIK